MRKFPIGRGKLQRRVASTSNRCQRCFLRIDKVIKMAVYHIRKHLHCLHCHFSWNFLSSLSGDWIWVVDLGCDRIRHYRKSNSGPQPVATSDIGWNADEEKKFDNRSTMQPPELDLGTLSSTQSSPLPSLSVNSKAGCRSKQNQHNFVPQNPSGLPTAE